MNVYITMGSLRVKDVSDLKIKVDSFKEQCFAYFLEKNRYRIMWALRSLEQTIDNEGGFVLINEEAHISFEGLSDETIQKAHDLIFLELGSYKIA